MAFVEIRAALPGMTADELRALAADIAALLAMEAGEVCVKSNGDGDQLTQTRVAGDFEASTAMPGANGAGSVWREKFYINRGGKRYGPYYRDKARRNGKTVVVEYYGRNPPKG